MIWIPIYFRTVFDLNRPRNRYVLTICPPAFNRIPAELKVERRQSDTIRADADLILCAPAKSLNRTTRRLAARNDGSISSRACYRLVTPTCSTATY